MMNRSTSRKSTRLKANKTNRFKSLGVLGRDGFSGQVAAANPRVGAAGTTDAGGVGAGAGGAGAIDIAFSGFEDGQQGEIVS